MADVLVVKTEFNSDIRRFAVPETSFTLKYVYTTVSLLYQLSPENIRLFGVNNGAEFLISSAEDLKQSIQTTPHAGSMSRLIIKNVPAKDLSASTETYSLSNSMEQPSDKAIEKSYDVSDEMVQKLMEHPKVQAKIQEMVTATLRDKKTISKLAKKLNKRKKSKRESKEIATENLETSAQDSLSSSNEMPVTNDEPEEQKEIDATNTETKDEVAQFVVVENKGGASIPEPKKELKFTEAIEAKLEALSSSPIVQSFLALFKPKKSSKENSQDESDQSDTEEKKEAVEVPEETLKQLQDMGFEDREANVKTLKFHKKFNEGLDAVVEDLLQQKSTENKN